MSVPGRLTDFPCCLKHVSEGPILLQKWSSIEVINRYLGVAVTWGAWLAPALL
jgi:hypothetical protein